MKNQLKVFGEEILDKTFINIFFYRPPKSYKIEIQVITYMKQSMFEDIIDKLLIKTYKSFDKNTNKVNLIDYKIRINTSM